MSFSRPISIPFSIPIPIFIISRDRLDVLQKCVRSLKQIKTPYQVVIHDNASTFPPLIEYLKQGEKSGEFIVYWHKINSLKEAAKSVADYLQKAEMEGNKPPYYCVTDPDIELRDVNGDILEFYAHLLDKTKPGQIKVVGPMLEIDDLPDHYPLKERVIQSHTRQFWGKKSYKTEYRAAKFDIQSAMIDTTFGMYRSSTPWKPMNRGYRTYAPYSARHLDWYIDPENMSEDQKYYLKTCRRDTGHWSSSYLNPVLKKK